MYLLLLFLFSSFLLADSEECISPVPTTVLCDSDYSHELDLHYNAPADSGSCLVTDYFSSINCAAIEAVRFQNYGYNCSIRVTGGGRPHLVCCTGKIRDCCGPYVCECKAQYSVCDDSGGSSSSAPPSPNPPDDNPPSSTCGLICTYPQTRHPTACICVCPAGQKKLGSDCITKNYDYLPYLKAIYDEINATDKNLSSLFIEFNNSLISIKENSINIDSNTEKIANSNEAILSALTSDHDIFSDVNYSDGSESFNFFSNEIENSFNTFWFLNPFDLENFQTNYHGISFNLHGDTYTFFDSNVIDNVPVDLVRSILLMIAAVAGFVNFFKNE
jgi:hypothetical protein